MLTLKQNNIKAIQFYIHGKEGGYAVKPVSYTHLDVYKRQDKNVVFTYKVVVNKKDEENHSLQGAQ